LIPEDCRQPKHRPGPGVKAHYHLAQRRCHHQRSLSVFHKIEANGSVSLAEQDSAFAARNLARAVAQSLDQSLVRRKWVLIHRKPPSAAGGSNRGGTATIPTERSMTDGLSFGTGSM
jgi:hypothetical protein